MRWIHEYGAPSKRFEVASVEVQSILWLKKNADLIRDAV